MAGSLNVDGDLNVASNLIAQSISLGGETNSAWPRSQVVLASVVLTSEVASISFDAIPGSYRYLELVYTARTAQPAPYHIGYLGWQANGDTGSHYSTTQIGLSSYYTLYMPGEGSSSARFGVVQAGGSSTSAWSSGSARWVEYATVDHWKNANGLTTTPDGSGGSNTFWCSTGTWKSTAAITNLRISASSGYNLVPGSSFTLYGGH